MEEDIVEKARDMGIVSTCLPREAGFYFINIIGTHRLQSFQLPTLVETFSQSLDRTTHVTSLVSRTF